MKNTLKCAVLLFVLIFIGCQKETPVKVEKVTEAVSATAVSTTSVVASASTTAPVSSAVATESTKDWLAKLKQQINQVEYRQRNQNVWRPTEDSSSFMKYDALQTKNASTAEIIYQSGSILDVKENSLIIFDEDPGKKKKTEDRVIIKSGQLTGKTKTELWVFTDSGLVQIKAKKGTATNKLAEAKVIIKKDRAVNIKVSHGSAEIIYKKDNEFTRLAVAEQSDITLKPSTEVLTGTQVNEEKIKELVVAQAKTPTVAQADLAIEFPADNALVNDSTIEIRGRVTGAGAKLLINGQLAEVSDNGTFSKPINLQAGTNLIVFQIIRSDTSVKFIKRSVRYQPR